MPHRYAVALLIALLVSVASPAISEQNYVFKSGDVFIETAVHVPDRPGEGPPYEMWTYWLPYRSSFVARAGGALLIHKIVPWVGPGPLSVPRSDVMLFHHDQMVSAWDGIFQYFGDPGKGYKELFRSAEELGELAPLLSGDFLVAERSAERSRGAKLIEFNLDGVVSESTFPLVIDPSTGRALGASHFDVLEDMCTVLYTLGRDDPAGGRIRRFNRCTGEALADLATLLPGEYAGSVRMMANRHVVVANGSVIHELTPEGSHVRSYDFPGVTHLALTINGKGFFAAGVFAERADVRLFENGLNGPERRLPEIDGGMTTPLAITDLVVGLEWRAAASSTRMRAVRR